MLNNSEPTALNLAGIALTGDWSDAERATVMQVALTIAAIVPSFRLIFTPLVLTREHQNNVNLNGPAVWYAKNVGGYQVQFGNRVFFEGQQTVKRFPGTHFTTEALIAHEIGHTVNFRHDITRYAPAYQNNRLLGFVARSSDLPAEIITDALANFCLGTLKDTTLMQTILAEVAAATLKPRPPIPADLQAIFAGLQALEIEQGHEEQ